jgi:hypothetical protein
MMTQTRKRTPIALILYALYLYFSSLSLRKASHVLEPIIKRSHVAIWKWIQKYSFVFDSFDVDKHDVNSIFIDETEINIGGKKAWLWVAYEPQLKAFLSFYISWHPELP